MCLDDVASGIVHANHSVMRPAAKLRVSDGMIRFSVPGPTEWQRIGDEIDAAFIFARVNFVNVDR
jgi:hypothetical protein